MAHRRQNFALKAEDCLEEKNKKNLHSSCELTEAFVENNFNKIHWGAALFFQKFSESFLRKHLDKILNSTENRLFDFIPLNNLSNLVNYQKISSQFLEELMSMPEAAKYPYLWTNISRAQKLSYDFITNHKFKLNWAFLCTYQNLTSELMEDNLSLLSFAHLSRFQKLSPDFINKYFDKLVISQLIRNKKLPLESKKALLNHSEKIVFNLFKIKD